MKLRELFDKMTPGMLDNERASQSQGGTQYVASNSDKETNG